MRDWHRRCIKCRHKPAIHTNGEACNAKDKRTRTGICICSGFVDPWKHVISVCPGDDPTCPGHDHGDPCHYRGDYPMPRGEQP